jgi:16S rRNA (cytosine967-C5)-methyltransferase
MASNARSVALSALLQVANDDAYLNLVLPKKIENARLQTSDAAFATELAYGTARSQGFYDFVIEKVSGRSVEEIDVDVLVLLRLSAHQLLSLETPAHAAIFEMVEIAKKELRQSVAGFVNATLRRISEKSLFEWHQILDAEGLSEDEFLSIRYSHPIWVTRALKLALQSEGSATDLEEALASDNLNPKVDLVPVSYTHLRAHETG